MRNFDDTSSTSNRSPLLSPASRSSAGDGGYGPNTTYGSNDSEQDDHHRHHHHPIAITTDSPSSHDGVEQADAINQAWSKAALVTAYLFIFLCSFANALQWQIISNLLPYVVSEFSSHSLIPTINIVSSVLSGVLKLPVAKIVDSWGRAQGFAAVTLIAASGLLLMALCQGVKTYAAAQVVYSVGISGFTYILDVIVADTSSLRNRSLAIVFKSAPFLVTTLIGPVIASFFTENGLWRWVFGTSAVIFVLMSLPLFTILISNMRKAETLGLLHRSTRTGPSISRKIQRYLHDFDALGVFLLSAGLMSILVPFSLSSKSTSNISLGAYTSTLALGFGFILTFALHERRTNKPLAAFSLLFSRNIAGACLLSVAIFIAYFAWDGYYISYLQVVHGLSITEAGYIGQIYSIGSSLWGFAAGYLIRRSDRFKWLALLALPVHIFGGVLMIVFRRPDSPIIMVITSQVVLTLGGSTLVLCLQMAVMTVVSHAELASAMAIVSLATYLGSAVGSSLSGAIWNSTLPQSLAEFLPDLSPGELAQIASDLKKQLSYPMGSPVRAAIVAAYAKSQVRMCVVGTLASLFEIVAVLMFKDGRLSQSRQVKGTVL
ncbi:major facilitator superfamily domain-containing protein [Xylaria sp. CBS 124048]|nr:major facilitator superfamily domain-containing protein [Xylaria sp. CBS 124048]